MVVPRRAAFAEESAEVEVLYANLDTMKSLTKKIQGSMSRLDMSGKVVQDAIGPIYGNTQKLQTQNNNIDRILEAIDRIREPLDMRNREERIIRGGPQKIGLNEYISSIDRTNQALRELKQSNLRSNQQAITELNGLLVVGIQQLEDVFRHFLQQDLQTVEPLHYITKNLDFPRLPSNRTSQLRDVNMHICNFAKIDGRSPPSSRIYAEVRGRHLTSSLQNLAAASIATARKVNADEIYKQGSNAIGTYANGIRGMYTAEYDNICPIFPREEWGQVLSMTSEGSMAAFAATLRDLDAHIRTNLVTDCYLAYEIIDVVSNMSFQLENRTGELKLPLSEAMKPIRETAKSSLSSLLNDTQTKIQQMLTLPGDGSAIPIASDTMTRLQLMTQYLPPLSSIMTSLGDGGWSSPAPSSSTASVPTLKSFDVGADGKKLFAHYATDTIDTLLSSLEARARAVLKSKPVQGVFMANNIAVVDRMIRSSDLEPLLEADRPKLDTWKRKATGLYLSAWDGLGRSLFDKQVTSKSTRPPSTGQAIDSSAVLKQLSGKEKDQIKESFRAFNVAFDELVAKHKSFKMEREVRQEFAKGVQGFLEALYARYWDRYHEIDKGKGKYVKYDKGQMSAVLASLA